MERLRHKKIKIQKRGLANYLEYLLNIFRRSGPRAPDPYLDPKTGSSTLQEKATISH